jgi:hypothetical protein
MGKNTATAAIKLYILVMSASQSDHRDPMREN